MPQSAPRRNQRFESISSGPQRSTNPNASQPLGSPAEGSGARSTLGGAVTGAIKNVGQLGGLSGGQEGRGAASFPGLARPKEHIKGGAGDASATPGAKQPSETGGAANRPRSFVNTGTVVQAIAAGSGSTGGATAAGLGKGATTAGQVGLQGQSVVFGGGRTPVTHTPTGLGGGVVPVQGVGKVGGFRGVRPTNVNVNLPQQATFGQQVSAAARSGLGAVRDTALSKVGIDQGVIDNFSQGNFGSAAARFAGNNLKNRIGSENPGGQAPRLPEEGLPAGSRLSAGAGRGGNTAHGNPRFTRRKR